MLNPGVFPLVFEGFKRGTPPAKRVLQPRNQSSMNGDQFDNNISSTNTNMKKLSRSLALLSVAGFLITAVAPAQAQAPGQGRPGGQGGGRGNFDPAQMQERMLENYREQLKITNDDEWKIVSERITAVMTARRDTVGGFGRGGFSRGAGRPGGQGGGRGGDTADRPTRGSGGGGENAEEAALRKAVDDNADAAVIKAKLADYRKAKAANEAKLAKAQKDLKEVLNLNQEAVAVLGGLLP
jgi:hypothetical protein